ncbi:hypothetical protein SLS53_003777 [Cytospora paraplurivora]|uniref:Uncharacterized protein n=1 Tax=Cytospora paraplurivora TaxID=2898453 RepID=A0AAN9UCA2_9PEZI
MGKLIILTGAPESDRLDWTSPDLLQTFLDPIARFAHLQPQAEALIPPIPAEHQHRHQRHDKSNLDLAVWRSLPLQRTHVPTGFSQQHDLNLVGHFPSSADFLTTAGISFEAASQGLSQEDAEEESSRLLGEFYEHSFAVHHHLPSSQLVPHSQSQGQGKGLGGARVGAEAEAESHAGSGVGANATSLSSGEQQEEDSATILAGDTTMAVKAPFRPGVRGREDHLSDLEDIPPASYILSTMPQTITVTLIVGIISIAAPRTVETRYGTAQTLVEVLVGDETKSGFSVTFWLSGADGGPGGGVLAGLRGQDVVLMQNVALNVFRGKVYGGSLRKVGE